MAALIVLGAAAVRWTALGPFLRPKQFHDIGKLLFGFCLLTGDFFYSQFLVIWYSNLPEETKYVIRRVRGEPWEPLAFTILFICFAIPFVALLSRKLKMKPMTMAGLSILILVGMWLERLLLVGPSVWEKNWIPLGFFEVCITIGFLGGMGLSVLWFLRRFPLLPVSDPLFRDYLKRLGEESEGSH